MKSIYKPALALLFLAPLTHACTEPLLMFDISVINAINAQQGKPLALLFPFTTTSYTGANGGAVRFTVSSTGSFTNPAITATDAKYGQNMSGSFTVTGTPTAAGLQTGSVTFSPFCGNFPGSPISISYNITATPATTTIPPTFYQNPFSGLVNHPISTSTGELTGFDETADLALGGPLALEFRRYYASYLKANNVSSAVGANWMHNFDVKAAVTQTSATVTLFRGKTVTFTRAGTAFTLSSTERRPYQLVTAGTGFQFMNPVVNLIYSFDSTGALTKIEDRNGNALTVTQASGGVGPATISDGLGRTLTFTYTGTNLTKVQDHSGRNVNFEQAGGNLATFVNAAGKRTTFAYTTAGTLTGLLTAETRPLGNKRFTQTFDAQGRVAGQTDALSNTTTFTYASNGNGATVNEPSGVTFTHVHDTQRNLTGVSDPSGGSSAYTYDASGRPTGATDRLGQKTSTTWDPSSGLVATYTDAAGGVTTYRYASTLQGAFAFYDLQSVRYADGSTASYTRDNKGNPLSYTDQNGRTWQMTYNARGQWLTFATPSGTSGSLSAAKSQRQITVVAANAGYNETNANLAIITLSEKDITRLEQDSLSRLIKLTNPDLTTRQFTYDSLGTLNKFTDELGNSTTATFDDNGNLKSVIDALSNTTIATYNGMDLISGLTDEAGKTTQYTYDALLRRSVVTDPTKVVTNFNFNSLNQATGILNTNNKGLTLGSDRESRIDTITNAVGGVANISYALQGGINQTTDPNRNVARFFYDLLNRNNRIQDPLGRDTNISYDPVGNPINVALPGGISVGAEWNEFRQLTKFTDPNGNTSLTNRDVLGRPIDLRDTLGRSTKIDYDPRSKPFNIVLPDLSTVKIERDAGGNPVKQIFSGGLTRNFVFDAGRRCTRAPGYTATFDAAGNLTESNGFQNLFDDAKRLRAITVEPGKQVVYAYSNTGALQSVTPWIGGPIVFNRNAADQVINIVFPNGVQEDYLYDPNGNRTSTIVKRPGQTLFSEQRTFDLLNRPLRVTIPTGLVGDPANGAMSFNYDAANQVFGNDYNLLGQPTKDPARTYAWDPAGNLASYSGLDGAATFLYDGFDEIIARRSENFQRNCAILGCQILTEKTGSSVQTFNIFTPSGELLLTIDGATAAPTYFHFDGAGNTRLLTNAAGNAPDLFGYTPDCDQVFHTGSSPTRFTCGGRFGVQQEGNTGLFSTGTGFYNATTLSYLTPAIFEPIRDLAFRGSYNRAVRAPTVQELFGVRQSPPTAPSFVFQTGQPFGTVPLFDLSGAGANTAGNQIPDPYRGVIDPGPDPRIFLEGNSKWNPPAVGPTTASFAPGFVAAASSSCPIPRFADTPAVRNFFTPNPCLTALLYPYVTNLAGFDTGFAIQQTSADPFGTRASGTAQIPYNAYQIGGLFPGDQFGVYSGTGSNLADVPSSHPYFQFIQKLRELRVTNGTRPPPLALPPGATEQQIGSFILRSFLN